MVIRDGDWELFSYDPATGRQVWLTYDERGNTVTRTSYPVADIITQNQAVKSDMADRGFGDWNLIARVPLNVAYEQLDTAVEQGDGKYLSKWFNDSDNAAWRTSRGRV